MHSNPGGSRLPNNQAERCQGEHLHRLAGFVGCLRRLCPVCAPRLQWLSAVLDSFMFCSSAASVHIRIMESVRRELMHMQSSHKEGSELASLQLIAPDLCKSSQIWYQ